MCNSILKHVSSAFKPMNPLVELSNSIDVSEATYFMKSSDQFVAEDDLLLSATTDSHM